MQVDKADIERQYAAMSAEELAAINPLDLNELGRECYNREVSRRRTPEYQDQERQRLQLREDMPVLVRSGGLKSQMFPTACPCCLSNLTGNDGLLVPLRKNLIPGLALVSYSIRVPYCKECWAHVASFRSPRFAGSFMVIWTALVIAGLAWLYADKILPSLSASEGVFIVLALGLILPLTIYFLAFRPRRRERAKQLTKPECCSTDLSVRLRGNSLVFRNGKFGKAFADMNGLGDSRQHSENVVF